MDTSISQQGTNTAREILRHLVCSPGHIITEASLIETGVDVDLLESTYDTNIKPYLDYLHGYARIEELDPLKLRRSYLQGESLRYTPEYGSWSPAHNGKDHVFLWYSLLARYGMLGRRIQALLVTQTSFSAPLRFPRASDRREVTVALFLTRSNKWLLWLVEGNAASAGSTLKNEQLSVHETVREAWEFFQSLLPEYFENDSHHSPAKYLPILTEHALRRILKATVEEKERRLETLKSSLESAERRVKIIHR
jgi:hypothetical protein